jgi:penicillin amidase
MIELQHNQQPGAGHRGAVAQLTKRVGVVLLNLFKKILKAGGIVLAVLLLTAGVGLLWYRSASQPQVDGRLQLVRTAGEAAGTTAGTAAAAIEIVRDAEAVPHIFAKSANDAYFALGFAHAQDRLWQLEMHRRIASGRLAEILGPNALDTDRFLRTLGVRHNAEAILPNLTPAAQASLRAYADGINAYLRQRHGPLPPEFVITGTPAPELWQPADSIAWETMMAWDLGTNWSQELMRMRLAQKLSLAQINEIMPPYPGDPVLATRDYTGLYRSLAGTVAQLSAVAAIAPSSHVEGMGSNNWVVSGARTASGKPLLANDPHLGMTAPALWYLAHLSAPGLNAVGASMPGLPGIVLGHNDRVAWGFTNTASDVQDLYIERVNPANPRQYQTPDGWADFGMRSETIRVKGQPDVQLLVRSTRHGPVISGALPLLDRTALDARTHVIAFAWTALRPDDRSLQGALGFNTANNWEQFLAAARDFSSPQQNVVYADVDGNIGFVAPGRVPVRGPANDLHGLAPAPGWEARYDWQGFVPFEALPQRFNPASGRVVTANHKIVDPGYQPFLTSEWSLPYRADRINAMLDAQSAAHAPFSVPSFQAMQYDHVSLAALDLLPIVRGTQARTQRGVDAMKLLATWNGGMDVDRPEPLIFNAWMREFSRRLLLAPLGADLMRDYFDQRNAQPMLIDVLKNPHGQGHWCNVPADGALPAAADCKALLAVTLETTLDALEKRYGGAPGSWRWGKAHYVVMEHRPFGKVPALSSWFDIELPVPGDTYTVNVGRYSFKDDVQPFASRHAAGLRAVYDLSNLDASRFIQSSGQSGNVLSRLYAQYAHRWSAGQTFMIPTQRATAEQNGLGTLVLVP